MRLPRRTPFINSKSQELEYVYRGLYPHLAVQSSNPDQPSSSTPAAPSQSEALSIVQLWINRSACPHAVESTASLVQACLLDQHLQTSSALPFSSPSSSSFPLHHEPFQPLGGGAELGVRMNYSMAITRFVNSLVDSYQTGNFAQSISSIAARIGLPLWFVEIRHAGTHEELPSLVVCRQATHAALDWLHANFWLPTLFPQRQMESPANQTNGGGATSLTSVLEQAQDLDDPSRVENVSLSKQKALEELGSHLRSYRKLAKTLARDQSQVGRNKALMKRICKDFEGWVQKRMESILGRSLEENKITSGMGRKRTREEMEEALQSTNLLADEDEQDMVLGGALGRGVVVGGKGELRSTRRKVVREMVSELVRPGGLIPLSKSKRPRSTAESFLPMLSQELEDIWSPLLVHIGSTTAFSDDFFEILAGELVESIAFTRSEASIAVSTLGGLGVVEGEDWRVSAWSERSYKDCATSWLLRLVQDDKFLARGKRSSPSMRMSVVEMCLSRPCDSTIAIVNHLTHLDRSLAKRLNPLIDFLDSRISLRCEDLLSFQEPILSPVPLPRDGEGEEEEAEGDLIVEGGGEEDAEEEREAMEVEDQTLPKNPTGFEDAIKEMEQRLEDLREMMTQNRTSEEIQPLTQPKESIPSSSLSEVNEDPNLPKGWSLYPENEWKPTPIGCLDGMVPNLLIRMGV
ncbi:Las1-domain-containing protein [Violaceomyces palustris]|uniref:Las1-domain-containing protein n=1 Tax=Violaceomyces palustris TaxID=1673888 RepID=A0ACD0P5C1_9BASI|nr:Las1-domain-containing protein [Violaceomyces palustris]